MRQTGRISIHPRGFGFLNLAGGGSAFVPPGDLNPFLTDDVVTAEVTLAADGRTSASRLTLVSRSRQHVFGDVVVRRRRLFLRVDREVSNTDWELEIGSLDIEPGDVVVARLDGDRLVAQQRLLDDADLPLERLILRYDLAGAHAAEAMAEASRVPEAALGAAHRRDLRHVPTITIDAASTRDIDDAVSVLPAASDGALRLLVSIADPAEYVQVGSALDTEARHRGTTVYLPGRVLPMLPDVLSADRLSLWPGVDRYTLTVELRIDAEGRVTAADPCESISRSWARLTYDEVDAFLAGGEISEAMAPVQEAMPWFRTAGARLGISRGRRGGVSMPRDEALLTLDEDTGEVTGVGRHRTTAAHLLIERFMVAANEAVGAWLQDRGVPAVYRVHPEPDADRVADLAACAHHFGYEAGFPGSLSPVSLAAFEAQITGSPAEAAIRSVMLRALGPARYTVTPGPHFGLASTVYLHFTSPLRRYADLAVHRALKRYLRGHRDFIPLDPDVETLSIHLNERTRAAGRAETDRHRMLAATLMQRHIGETFHARITRIRPFGVVAQLDTSLVEGLIPLEALPDGPYRPEHRDMSLVGPKRVFTVGMPVTVRVRATDPAQGRIDYDWIA